MKLNLFILLILLCYNFTSMGQEKKDLLLIGGNIGGMYLKNKVTKLNVNNNDLHSNPGEKSNFAFAFGTGAADHSRTTIQITPNVGYYLNNRFLLGVGFEWLKSVDKFETDYVEKTISSSHIVYPFLKYYIYQRIFLQGQFNIGKTKSKVESTPISIPVFSGFTSIDYSGESETNTHGFGVSAGYSIELGEKIITDIALSYGHHNNKSNFEKERDIKGKYNSNQNLILLSIGLKYRLKSFM